MFTDRMARRLQKLEEYRQQNAAHGDTFQYYFKQMICFIAKKQRYPTQKEDISLYNWISAQRTERKKGLLNAKYEEQLNSVNFVWDKREFNWLDNYERVVALLNKGLLPSHNKQTKLYSWLNLQLELLELGELDPIFLEKTKGLLEKVTEIRQAKKATKVVKVLAKDLKWNEWFRLLKEYRERKPRSWPRATAADDNERKLGIWCQDLRARFRKGILEERWQKTLEDIGFNFGGRIDNWMERYREYQRHLQNEGTVPIHGHYLNAWADFQSHYYNNLSVEQQTLLKNIGVDEYRSQASNWELTFAELASFIKEHKKLPTRKSKKELSIWIAAQRTRVRKGHITPEQIKQLKAIGVDLNPTANRQLIWNETYMALIKFRNTHPEKWPSYYGTAAEKKLYVWCQAQRQAFVGTLARRNPLEVERIEMLTRINFNWTYDEMLDKRWEERYKALKDYLDGANTPATIPVHIAGKYNPLYGWLREQQKLATHGELSEKKIERLKALQL